MEFENVSIYTLFSEEWVKYRNLTLKSWNSFIKSKNLGITCTELTLLNNKYKIVDEKKWFLTKLKYGI